MADEPTGLPSQEDLAGGAEVVEAGKAAAAAEPDPSKRREAAAGAIREAAGEKGWKLSQDEAEMIASAVVAQAGAFAGAVADEIQQRGGFDRLPDPVVPPPAPTGTGELPEQPPVGDAGEPAHDQLPAARGASGFASWFRGGR